MVLQELLRRAAQDEQAGIHAAKLAASAAVGALPPLDAEAAAQPLALAASLSSQVREEPNISSMPEIVGNLIRICMQLKIGNMNWMAHCSRLSTVALTQSFAWRTQASELQRAHAYLVILREAAAAPVPAEGDNSGAIPQLQLATLFVASGLQREASARGSSDEAHGRASLELQGAYAALLLQALLQQQV